MALLGKFLWKLTAPVRFVWHKLTVLAGRGARRAAREARIRRKMCIRDSPYIVKTYFEGRECNLKDVRECQSAARTLGRLHKAMCQPGIARDYEMCIRDSTKPSAHGTMLCI